MNKTVVIDENLCTACGTCVEMCPKKILYIDEVDNVCRVTDESKCDRLGGCERKCTAKAIKIYK
ncbi:MAG: 4Fe-4S binding protein [Dehalococcoidia bacterium]|jgi:2-oxoglutarate ferredoxin oxidoreductase subunit delta